MDQTRKAATLRHHPPFFLEFHLGFRPRRKSMVRREFASAPPTRSSALPNCLQCPGVGDDSLELWVATERIEVAIAIDQVQAETGLETGPEQVEDFHTVFRMALGGEGVDAANLVEVRSTGVGSKGVAGILQGAVAIAGSSTEHA